MDPKIIIGVIGVAAMITLLMLRMWIGVAMMLVGFVGYAIIRNFEGAIGMLSVVPFSQATYYTLTTLPLFIFMGQVLFNTNIGRDLYESAHRWVGHVRGGLVMATVPTCAAFGAVTGIPTPAAVTMGKTALPEMRKFGYSDWFSTGSIVSSSELAVLIPPSIPMIIYGILTETSVGTLFIAGILPGITLAIMFMITIFIICRINPRVGPAGPRFSWRERFSSLRLIWPVVALFLLVLGGIYGGYVTTTEAGALGAFGACLIAGVVMRRLTLKLFLTSLLEAAGLTAAIMLLIIGAQVFGRFLALSRLPAVVCTFLAGLDIPLWGVFMLFVLLYVIMGMLMDVMSAVIITMPVVFPTITAMGFDPIWFGVIIILLVQMGEVTPPVGLDVFIISGTTGVPLFTVFKGVWPFVLTMLIAIVIFLIFPDIVLLLPSTMPT